MNGDPIAQASRDPVSDSGPILRHRSGPSSQLSVPLPDSWRVLKTRKDSDSHPPPPNPGVYRCAPDPISKKKKRNQISPISLVPVSSRLPRRSRTSSVLASNDAVQSYSQILSSV